MNETEKMEKLLRNPPRIKVPSGLREKLHAGIVLPRATARASAGFEWQPLLRRWLPALSFSAFFLVSLVAIAVQSNMLSELRQENVGLRASNQGLDQLRDQNAEYQKLRVESQQLVQLRKDRLELQALQRELTQLRAQLSELSSLQSEQQRLLAEQKVAEARASLNAPPEVDPFDEARNKAEKIRCISNIKQIGLAARLWANDNQDTFPSNFLTMSNELNSPKLLVCPGDTNRAAALNWSVFSPANVSYEMLSPGVPEGDPNVVVIRCPIHHSVGLADGSAHMINPSETRIVQRNGKWVLENVRN